jgi:hypothetical protein
MMMLLASMEISSGKLEVKDRNDTLLDTDLDTAINFTDFVSLLS